MVLCPAEEWPAVTGSSRLAIILAGWFCEAPARKSKCQHQVCTVPLDCSYYTRDPISWNTNWQDMKQPQIAASGELLEK